MRWSPQDFRFPWPWPRHKHLEDTEWHSTYSLHESYKVVWILDYFMYPFWLQAKNFQWICVIHAVKDLFHGIVSNLPVKEDQDLDLQVICDPCLTIWLWDIDTNQLMHCLFLLMSFVHQYKVRPIIIHLWYLEDQLGDAVADWSAHWVECQEYMNSWIWTSSSSLNFLAVVHILASVF